MNTTASLKGVGTWKRNAYQRLFDFLSPRISIRFKELIFVSSVTGLIQEVNDPDLKLMREMNKVFKIAQHPDALAYPVYFKSVIWHDYIEEEMSATSWHKIKVQEVLTKDTTFEKIREVGSYFAKSCPAWLKFADPEYMIEVFVKLVNCIRRHQGLNIVAPAPTMCV